MRIESVVSPLAGARHLAKPDTHLRSLAALVVSAALLMTGLAGLVPPGLAANVPGETPQRADLNAIIDGLQRKYSRMRGLEANFVQVYQGADGRTAREAGHLLLKRPAKARWEYSEPERKLFVSDGNNIFFHVAGERQATQTTVRQSADPQIPFLFLLGRGNLRRDFSRIEVAANENPAGAGNVVLRLVPKRAPEEFRQLLVEVTPSSFEVRRMVIFERNGSRMDFLLSDVRENYLAPDSQFQFTPPPGVVVKKAQ